MHQCFTQTTTAEPEEETRTFISPHTKLVAFRESTYEAIDEAVKKQLLSYTTSKREERTLYEKNLRHDRLFGAAAIANVQEARNLHNADMKAKAAQQSADLAQQDIDRYKLKVFLTIK